MTTFQFFMIMGSIWWCSGDASKNNTLRVTGVLYFLVAIIFLVAGEK